MKAKILAMKPPEKYEEGLFTYEEGVDVAPEILDYVQHGFNMHEALKMDLLVRIECQKKLLQEGVKDYADMVEEIKEEEAYIQELINQYNSM